MTEERDVTTLWCTRETKRLAHKLKARMEAPNVDTALRSALERALAES